MWGLLCGQFSVVKARIRIESVAPIYLIIKPATLNEIATTVRWATKPNTCWPTKRHCSSSRKAQSSTGKPFGGFSDLWLCGSLNLYSPSSASSKPCSSLISAIRLPIFSLRLSIQCSVLQGIPNNHWSFWLQHRQNLEFNVEENQNMQSVLPWR